GTDVTVAANLPDAVAHPVETSEICGRLGGIDDVVGRHCVASVWQGYPPDGCTHLAHPLDAAVACRPNTGVEICREVLAGNTDHHTREVAGCVRELERRQVVCRRIERICTRDRREQGRGIVHRGTEGRDAIERRPERYQSETRHASVARLDPGHAAERRRL